MNLCQMKNMILMMRMRTVMLIHKLLLIYLEIIYLLLQGPLITSFKGMDFVFVFEHVFPLKRSQVQIQRGVGYVYLRKLY
jgi:hypothetical protein